MTRKLRVSHLTVQAVLTWDDGEELSPGPAVHPATVSVSGLASFLETLKAEMAKLEESDQL